MTIVRRASWYIHGFLHKHGKILLVSMFCGIAIFVFVPNIIAILPAIKKTTYVGRVGRFALSGIPRDIQEKVSIGLTKVDADGQILPGVASSYRVEEDGKVMRFTLRPNMFWQDGEPLTPKDVDYVFSDTEVSRSQNDILYRITAPKQNESAQEPTLPTSFLSTVSQPLFRQVQTRNWLFRPVSKIIGLGEYQIVSLQYSGSVISQIVLESDKERLVYRFFPTEHDAIVAFKLGVVDVLEHMQSLEDLENWDQVSKHIEVHTDQYVGIFFNLNYQQGDSQPLSSRSLRYALNYAIQKKQGAERIYSPIQTNSWAAVESDDEIDVFDQDMTEAVNNLLKTETIEPLSIELTTIPSYGKLAEEIKQSWEELGSRSVEQCTRGGDLPTTQCQNKAIQVSIRLVNVPDLSNYQVLLIGQQIPSDPDQYALWHSTQSTNFTHFKNARVDKLLEDGRRIQDKEQRKLIYQEFQRLIVKESPAIFLEPITTFTLKRKQNLL